MRTIAVVALVFVACSTLPHVDPRPRTNVDAARATVTVRVSCSSADPFPQLGATEFTPRLTTSWYANAGTGAVISERHVLTAAHVIAPCPDIPRITVTLYDGRSFRVFVDKRRGELVRLQILSGSTFRRYIAPPALGDSDGVHYKVATRRGVWVGDRTAWLGLGKSDSGAFVYAPSGVLVGLLLGTDERGWLDFARVDASWLEGT